LKMNLIKHFLFSKLRLILNVNITWNLRVSLSQIFNFWSPHHLIDVYQRFGGT
jgi:hypothetical protein